MHQVPHVVKCPQARFSNRMQLGTKKETLIATGRSEGLLRGGLRLTSLKSRPQRGIMMHCVVKRRRGIFLKMCGAKSHEAKLENRHGTLGSVLQHTSERGCLLWKRGGQQRGRSATTPARAHTPVQCEERVRTCKDGSETVSAATHAHNAVLSKV